MSGQTPTPKTSAARPVHSDIEDRVEAIESRLVKLLGVVIGVVELQSKEIQDAVSEDLDELAENL